MKLLETIRFENGHFANLELHQQRMNASRKALFSLEEPINLHFLQASALEGNRSSGFAIRMQGAADLQSAVSGIKNPVSPDFQIANLKELEGLFKCRIIYSQQIEKIEFIPYRFPTIKSLKMVVDDTLEYSHKYLDRSRLNQLISKKGNHDDILIVKNGLITDTSFANILFFNGKQWLTPAHPLLKGTQRQFLLQTEKIITADIRPKDVKQFRKVRLINAMMRFEDAMDIPLVRICNPDALPLI